MLNPAQEWMVEEVPDLRILDDELWNRVKARQKQVRANIMEGDEVRSERARRPRYLFQVWSNAGYATAVTCSAVRHTTPVPML
jgi:hypothetical protein